MQLTLSASSAALFSTWIWIEELGLLFDAGEGVSAVLMQKSRKIESVFLSHADRDHVFGLLQLHQLNASSGKPRIFYPADCGSFPALRDFMGHFDPQSGPATWTGLNPGDFIPLKNGFSVRAHPSSHITAEGKTKALAYSLFHSRRCLKPEFQNFPGPQLAELRKINGDEWLTEEKRDAVIGYSGDTEGVDVDLWAGHKILIQECTFLDPSTARRAHSNLPQVIRQSAGLPLQALILLHFSARHSEEEIRAALIREADIQQPDFPVFAVFPGIYSENILASPPVWQPPAR